MNDSQGQLDGMPERDEDGAILPDRIRAMYRLYGKATGYRCKDCGHFYRRRWDKTYFKCDLNRDTHGPGTDWRANWAACGKWEPS